MTNNSDDLTVVPIKRGRGGRTSGTRHGNGAGKLSWGGKPNGTWAAFEKGHAVQRDPAKRIAREQRAEALNDHLFDLAMTAARQSDQIQATVAALDRIEGRPVQRNVNVNMDDPNKLSDAELARIARQGLDQDGPRGGDALN